MNDKDKARYNSYGGWFGCSEFGGDNMWICINEGWTDDNWDIDIDEEIKWIRECIEAEENYLSEEFSEDFYRLKEELIWLQELSKVSIPTLIVALEDLYEDNFKITEERRDEEN